MSIQGLITGKVAVITGAGSGVGRAAALQFTRHGARVVIADVDRARIEETVAAVRKEGGDAVGVTCDVSDEEQVNALVKTAVEKFGRLDIIYNNAGITVPPLTDRPGLRRLVDTGSDQIDRVIAVNVRGVMNGCKAAIRQFEKQGGGGAIVNTASVAGLIGYGGVAYGATKGAVVAMTRTLALEVAPLGIRVNSVCPAGMLTHYAGLDPEGPNKDKVLESMAKAHPLGSAIDPMDTVNAALFLVSDMSTNITGVNLPVDGGLSAGHATRR
jgi:NAD(P)-dependent dehydrogenase (short-subunit alcohol dehydrogenase family)